MEESIHLMNHVIPRPCLRGVTPADVHEHKSGAKVEANREYIRTEQEKPNPPPWEKSYWEVIKGATGLELLTKFCFFSRRPLRTIIKPMPGGWRS